MRGTVRNVVAGFLAVSVGVASAAWAGQEAETARDERSGAAVEQPMTYDNLASDQAVPQEIQASVRPAGQRVIPEGYYPPTQVRLVPERMRRAANEPVCTAWFHNFANSDNDIFSSASDALDKPGFWFDNFASGDSEAFRSPDDEGASRFEREVTVDEDGVIDFGYVVQSTTAYATLALPDSYYETENNGVGGSDGVRIPKPFSFSSDDSPLILAEVTSPGSDGMELAVRRGGIVRYYGGGRRAAEIIERTPLEPRRESGDTPAMVPPAGGKVRRAEVKLPVVKLPTSSQGLGMASGFYPGR